MKKPRHLSWFFHMVDLKGFEPSTSRMRTERSPKPDISHPNSAKLLYNSLKYYDLCNFSEQIKELILTII